MKPEPVTKLDKKNTAILKKSDDEIMSGNCDVIALSNLWLIYSHPEEGFETHGL